MACARPGQRRRKAPIPPAAETVPRQRVLITGCLLAATGILRGVLGAEALGWWHTGVQYQMWQAVGLGALAGLGDRRMELPAALMAAGTVLFSVSLYAMALSGIRWLGAITPLGGILLIAGWLLAAWRA